MPLSWNEIRNRAFAFSAEWKDETSENAEAKSFWDDFFNVFGISRRRVASFEKHVKKGNGKTGFIDLLWKGTLLIEHKSKGRDLDRAHQQATDYFSGLTDKELPKFILVSDFQRFRLYDFDRGGEIVAEFQLADLPGNIKHFAFMAGYTVTEVRPEDPVNIKAAEKMGRLHDELKAIGYTGHDLERYLVRLLFCLFAEDTGIFEKNLFRDLIQLHTNEDGSDLADRLNHLFQVLNTSHEKRLATLPEQLAAFEYINGDLFAESLPVAGFNTDMRNMLLDACELDWAGISPAIFGSLFQSVMDTEERRNLGAHYTSEANILKLIKPLFLENLKAEFARVRKSKKKLAEFHSKLSRLTFLDPACGCGNFLVITYRELRLLELEVLKVLYPGGQGVIDVGMLIRVNVDQFYGIEYEEFPAQIAQVAMWLVDHQINLKVSEAFGMYFARIPLKSSANIVHGNALEIPWESVVEQDRLSYILGNPPFVGSKYQKPEQRAEIAAVSGKVKSCGILDYVTGWYFLAAQYMQGTGIECAFVSTNSIAQGEQVGVLWKKMAVKNISINFAHRTFQWNSEARGKAAVHCVIIGFAAFSRKEKRIYEYDDIRLEPHEIKAANINAYLVDGPSVVLENRRKPLCDAPKFGIGNKPIDGGHYLFTPEEKAAFLEIEPKAAPLFRQWIGAREFLNNIERWYLWLGDCSPAELKQMPACVDRVRKVQEYRLESKSKPTQKLAATPTRFHVENVPSGNFLVIPAISSERRHYIPIGFLGPEFMASNRINIAGESTGFHFGILSSTMHMSWMRYTTGRLKSDYSYSIGIVYNNYPWPITATDKQKEKVEQAAQAVLAARALFPDSTLADLYDPLTMPAELTKAHTALDRTVDKCYRSQPFTNELSRMQFLFALYGELTEGN
ncbi:Type II restriction/modification system, DNA methylase subunit YeeA [Candidatus Electrothrix aarhusensis]|uniref:site-specific DNA-methyltransferase (adenine-specific) n=1 Tax=Candidatus Electrothrix aarhusensis TaxID=1859131 RepID=A0A3S3QVZ0_9BACT|nr:Type II restriction/modification system, DNA methylase subunit YeeA [Candidatus Electrothrix aarhusensis]